MRRGAAAAVPAAVAAFLPLTATAAAAAGPVTPADAPSIAFNASTSATGVQITENLPGFIGTSTPFDGGGPTAQAVLSSFTGGHGYATFPDPGGFLPTLPGLGAGLFSSGAAGLPPLPIPFEVPNYPLAASSDSSDPQDSIGEGPYKLTTTTSDTSSDAFASAGFEPSGVGNAALVTSRASVLKQADGSILSTSTVVIQGLVVGPITFGEIRSVASEVLDATGTVTPKSSMQLSGVKIGGLPIGMTDTGFTGAPGQGPKQLNDLFAAMTKSSGHTVTVVAAQTTPTSVLSPTIQITGPLELPGVTTARGTYTINLGAASATLQGTHGAVPPTSAVNSLTTRPGGGGPTAAAPVGIVPGSVTPDVAAPAGVSAPAGAPPAAGLPIQTFLPMASDVAYRGDHSGFDGLYLMVVLGAGVALTSAVVIRRSGVGTS